MTTREAAELLSTKDNFLLLTHKNPDGDTVMSAAALCRALRRKNKKACLYRNPQINGKLLPFAEKLFAPDNYRPDYVISVDIAEDSLFPRGFGGSVDFCVDHHPTNSHYAAAELIDAERSACGEIVLDLIRALTGRVTKSEATLLYIALTTDTGAFRYANVNEQSFRAAAELMHCGADAQAVMLRFFRKTTAARLRLEGEIYSSLHYYRDDRLVIAPVTQEMIRRAGACEDDFDDLAGLSGRAENAQMNITVRELPNGESKISVRSMPGISSIALCRAFGGGGHEMAAGCEISEPPEKAERLLLEVIDALNLIK
ncbi:MAG: DHH family phosphoesterase [Oscillospiraceae bacterium]|nr:DHH family phosphoesterase [Oscillospiraceae bacterium]